jgi:hypothetical protein
MKAQIGKKAPLLAVSAWLQGEAVNLDQLSGNVVLVEVFQVNCPGCFLYALPQAIDLFIRYSGRGLTVLGVATAFEDFDKNNQENLIRLIENSEVVGETLALLGQNGKLIGNCLPYRIPFPLAMDRLNKRKTAVTKDEVFAFIKERIPDFTTQSEAYQQKTEKRVWRYLQSLDYHAETFEQFGLKGTPSHILIDKQGVLRDCIFGSYPDLEKRLLELLQE